MNYCIVENGIIANIIVADESFAKEIGAKPFYDGALRLTKYNTSPPLETVKQEKQSELSQVCNDTIKAGCDVTLSDGSKGRISMTDEDQINLMSAIGDVQSGASGTPYHLDGTLCRIYPTADIAIIAAAAKQHKLYHTTYCNHLNEWVRRCTSVEEVQVITYGAPLPSDLESNLNEVLQQNEFDVLTKYSKSNANLREETKGKKGGLGVYSINMMKKLSRLGGRGE